MGAAKKKTSGAGQRSPRARYILENYFLRESGEGFEAIAMHRGAVVGRFAGTDVRDVVRLARAHWGHFSHDDEARAFAEVFHA